MTCRHQTGRKKPEERSSLRRHMLNRQIPTQHAFDLDHAVLDLSPPHIPLDQVLGPVDGSFSGKNWRPNRHSPFFSCFFQRQYWELQFRKKYMCNMVRGVPCDLTITVTVT